jgi:hypothetical protein
MAMKSERKRSTTRSARYGGFDMAQSSLPWHCTRTQYGNMLVNCGWGEDGTEFSPFASVLGPAEAERCQAGHVALPALPRPGSAILCAPTLKSAARYYGRKAVEFISPLTFLWNSVNPGGQ